MTTSRWPPALLPVDLGVVVHGPVRLAAAQDVAAGLRCVWAHPGGLWLPLVVRARGVLAEAAVRRTSCPDPSGVDSGARSSNGLRVVIGVGDRSGVAAPSGGSSSGGPDDFTSEGHYWVGALPADGLLRLEVSWPHVGLPAAATTLRLQGLEDLTSRVVRLLP